jgi:hypothetical protein
MAPHADEQPKHAKGNEKALGGKPKGNRHQNRAVDVRGIQLLSRTHGSTYLAMVREVRHFSISWDACLEVRRSGSVW